MIELTAMPEKKKTDSESKKPRLRKELANKFRSLVENLTDDPESKERLIISNIENIYVNIKHPFYNRRLRLILSGLVLVNYIFMWTVVLIMGNSKNNSYCYDKYSTSFQICDINSICDDLKNGVGRVFFAETFQGEKIYNQSSLGELVKVNQLFREFFLKDFSCYSNTNKNSLDYTGRLSQQYNAVLFVTYRENSNIWIAFRQYCNKTVILTEFGATTCLSLTIGGIICGFLADIFGRKRILSIILFLQLLGSIGMFVFCYFMSISGDPSSHSYLPASFHRTYNVSEYSLTSPIFENFGVYDPHITQHFYELLPKISQIIVNDLTISQNFKELKLFFYLTSAIASFGATANFMISLALLMENSINDKSIYYSFLILFFGCVFSYPIAYLIILLDCLWLIFVVEASLFFLIFILLIFFTYESPRYHFEFREYDKLTNTMVNTVSKQEIAKQFISVNDKKVANEVKKMKAANKESLFKHIFFGVILYGIKKKLKKVKKCLDTNGWIEVKKSDIISNPLLIFYAIFSNKAISKNYLILTSLICTISLMYYINLGNFKMEFIISREDLYNDYFVNKFPFFVSISMVISNFFFYHLLKFFGYRVIFYMCFVFTFIFSIVYNVTITQSTPFEDMNIYYSYSHKIITSQSQGDLMWKLCVITFFVDGLYFALVFYLFKLSKTLYRCSFLGLCRVIMDLSMNLCASVVPYFPPNMIYLTLTSVVGLMISFFIEENTGDSIVDDFRQLEIENDVKK